MFAQSLRQENQFAAAQASAKACASYIGQGCKQNVTIADLAQLSSSVTHGGPTNDTITEKSEAQVPKKKKKTKAVKAAEKYPHGVGEDLNLLLENTLFDSQNRGTDCDSENTALQDPIDDLLQRSMQLATELRNGQPPDNVSAATEVMNTASGCTGVTPIATISAAPPCVAFPVSTATAMESIGRAAIATSTRSAQRPGSAGKLRTQVRHSRLMSSTQSTVHAGPPATHFAGPPAGPRIMFFDMDLSLMRQGEFEGKWARAMGRGVR